MNLKLKNIFKQMEMETRIECSIQKLNGNGILPALLEATGDFSIATNGVKYNCVHRPAEPPPADKF
uniref:Uncharacterized protein n=1 Tax=Romanomermis culicivorax TaxID=13658 RepID=A0A915JTT6_ROMCU